MLRNFSIKYKLNLPYVKIDELEISKPMNFSDCNIIRWGSWNKNSKLIAQIDNNISMSVKKVFIGMLFEMGSIGKSTQNRKLKEKYLILNKIPYRD